VTDRRNFRCRYGMPVEGMNWMSNADLLSFEEIEHVVRILVAMCVRDVRICRWQHANTLVRPR
jgi:cyclic pyranopterin phosphate synthase